MHIQVRLTFELHTKQYNGRRDTTNDKYLFWVLGLQSKAYSIELSLPTTVGSRSTKIALGTYFPDPVSSKKAPNDRCLSFSSSLTGPSCTSRPSGRMPCSRQYSSQHELPIWTPAWPMWIEIHSRYSRKKNYSTSITATYCI